MFESIVSRLLVKYVGNYVENVDKDQLKVGIFKGDLELYDLVLKRTALDGLDLPVSVSSGHLGKLIIKIPWTRLASQPVIAQVTDLLLVVQPKKCKNWDEDHERESRRESKKRRLESYESLREQKEQEEQSDEKSKKKDGKSDDTFTAKLVEKIVHNLQIKIQNIHIRYEDTSDADNPIIFGASLDSASFESVNHLWEPTFVSDVSNAQFMYKLAHLSQFSVYINHNDSTILSDTEKYPFKKVIKKMKKLITNHKHKTFVLRPINGNAKLTIQREGKINYALPRLKMDVEFEEVSLTLNDLQYKAVLESVDYVSNYQKYEQFRSLRPRERPSSLSSREKWWQYAYGATRKTIESKSFTWEDVMMRLTYKDQYIDLYKRSKNLPWHKPLNAVGKQSKAKIEEMLEYEDIVYFREIANEELKLEHKQHSEYIEKKGGPPKKGWLSWITGSGKEKYSEETEEAVKISTEQKDWLKQQIAYKEDEVSQTYKAPPDHVKFQINVGLKKGTLQLVDSRNFSTIIEGVYTDLSAFVSIRQAAHNVKVTLTSFEVFDRFTRHTQFEKIASRHIQLDGGRYNDESKYLASLDVQVSPLDGKSDLKVDLHLARLDLVGNIPLIQKVLGFFSKPTDVDLQSLRNAALSRFDTVKNQARAQLVMALQSKKVIDLNILLEAPTILFPQDSSSPLTAIVLVDLGRFSVQSHTDKQERQHRLQRGEKPKEDDFYDRFFLDMQDFQIVLTDLPQWQRSLSLNQLKDYNPLVERVSLGLVLKHSIMPLSLDREKTYVEGTIPSIKVHFSPNKMEKLMYLVNGVLQIADDPLGRTARHNRVLWGKFPVRGKLKTHKDDSEMENYWVELSQLGVVDFFEAEFDSKPIASIRLNHLTRVMEAKTTVDGEDRTQVLIELPQKDGTTVNVGLFPSSSQIRLDWLGKMRTVIQDLVDRHRHDLAKIESETEIEKEREEEEKKKLSEAVQVLGRFHLEEFSVMLSFEDEGQERRLSDLSLSGLHVDFTKRNFDMQLAMNLKNFSVTDLYDEVSTEHIIRKTNSDQNIASFSMTNAKAGSPLYSDTADSIMKMNFEELDVFFEQQTLSQFVLFGNRIQNVLEKLQPRKKLLEASEKKETALDMHNQLVSRNKRANLSLIASMEHMRLQLIDYGNMFSKMEMSSTTVQLLNGPSRTNVHGSVNNLKVVDSSGVAETSYQTIFGSEEADQEEQSFINFDFVMHKNLPTDTGVPQYDKELKLRMRSIRFTFLRRFITKLQVYFLNGPLMEVLKAGGKKAAELSVEAVKKQSQNINMIKMDISIHQPYIVVPTSSKSSNKLIANLGSISIHNQLTSHDNTFSENYEIEILDMGLQTINDLINIRPVVEKSSLKIHVSRAVVNPNHVIPDIILGATLEQMRFTLSHQQYKMVFDILKNNIQDTAGLTDVSDAEEKATIKKNAAKKNADLSNSDEVTSPQESIIANPLKIKMQFNFPHMDLTLFRGDGSSPDNDALARLDMDDLKVDFSQRLDGAMDARVVMNAISAYDNRRESTSVFRQIIATTGEDDTFLDSEETTQKHHATNILDLEFKKENLDTFINARLGSPTIVFVPEVAMEIKNFFMDRGVGSATPKKPTSLVIPGPHLPPDAREQETEGNVEIDSNWDLTEDIILTPRRLLLIKPNETGKVVINGNGHSIAFDTPHSETPLIHVSENMNVSFQNVKMKCFVPESEFQMLIERGERSTVFARPTEGVVKRFFKVDERDEFNTSEYGIHTDDEDVFENRNRVKVVASLQRPSFLFPEDASVRDTKYLCINTSINMAYESDPQKKNKEEGKFQMHAFRAFFQTGASREISANVVEPVDLTVELRTPNRMPVTRDIQLHLDSDISARISYNDVQMIKGVVEKLTPKSSNVQIAGSTTGEETPSENFLSADRTQATDDDFTNDDFASVESENDENDDFVDPDEGETPHAAVDIQPAQLASAEGSEIEDAPIDLPPLPKEEEEEEEPKEESIINIAFQSTKELSVHIVDDIRGYDIPLMNVLLMNPLIRASISLGAQMKVQSLVSLELSANYFNTKIAAWEPILEKWNGKVRFDRAPNRGNKEVPYTNVLLVSSGPEKDLKVVNVNLTQSMLETIMTTGKLWKEGFTKGSTRTVSKKYHPYTLRNHTGVDITVTQYDEEKEMNSQTLQSGTHIGFKMSEATLHFIPKHVIRVDVPGFKPHYYDIQKVGTFGSSNGKNFMCFENELKDGRKIITIRSGLKVYNNSTISWQLGIEMPNRRTELIGNIPPQEMFGIPLHCIEKGTLKIRPTDFTEEYDWSLSQAGFQFPELMKYTEKARVLTCKSTDPRETTRAYYAVVKIYSGQDVDRELHERTKDIQELQSFDFTIELSPPLLIENLLPRSIRYDIKDTPNIESNVKRMKVHSGVLKRGERVVLYTANLKNSILMKSQFVDEGWDAQQRLAIIYSNDTSCARHRHCPMVDKDKQLLFLHFDYNDNSGDAFREVRVYVPYWIVNHTTLPITILEHNSDPKNPGKKAAGHFELEQNVDSSVPLMFSFSGSATRQKQKKIAIAINGDMSPFFSLDNAGIDDVLRIKSSTKQYDIGYHSSIAPGKYGKIKVITIASRYIIANQTKYSIQVRQHGVQNSITLDPQAHTNFYWGNKNGSKTVEVLMQDTVYDWSPPFEVNNLGDLHMKFLHKTDPYRQSPYVLTATVVHDRATMYISIKEPKHPPYKFDNRLGTDLFISQSLLEKPIWWSVHSKKKTWYTWDDATKPQRIDIRIGNNIIATKFNANQVTYRPKLIKLKRPIDGMEQVYVSVVPKGPMIRVVLSDHPEQEVAVEETTKMKVAAELPQIGLSCINKHADEIAYLSLKNISARYETTDVNEYIEASVKRIQLDNQSAEEVNIPVVLSHDIYEDHTTRFLRLSSTRSLTEDTIHLFHYTTACLQQFNLEIDYNFAKLLLDFFSELSPKEEDQDEGTTEKMLDFSPQLPSNTDRAKRIYFDRLQLHPISLHLTFNLTKMADSDMLKKNPLFLILDTVGLTLVNCSDARIKLNALHLEYASFSSFTMLKDALIKHYKRAALGELYKIIGSLDIVGNPIGLVMDVSSGVKDFFYEPMKAIVHQPEDMGGVVRSIERGTSSLVNHTIHGGFSTASKITSSIGKGLSSLTFDEEYMQSREKAKRPVGFLEGVTNGGEALKKGFIEGATGLVYKPLEGFEKEGGIGLFKGIAKGFIGAPVKPVTGFFDFASKTTEGLSNFSRELTARERNIRTFGHDGRVVPYDTALAHCQMILHYVGCEGQLLKQYTLSEDERKVFIITNQCVLCAVLFSKTLEWKHDLDEITQVSYVQDKAQVIMQGKSKARGGFFSGSRQFTKVIQNTRFPPQMQAFFEALNMMINSHKDVEHILSSDVPPYQATPKNSKSGYSNW
mmetsp:Transcript_1298/g.4447  ORF Transcript_1298/g.4447 Transcript_1298/m.4447 type:complete len:3393 (-) Transcript_1298:60-10238(-)